MQSDALARLRWAFLGLALILTLPLLWLVHSVNQKVEAQRRLRHQVVAERIFDELERELTRVLGQESQRPSADFDERGQRERWAPYVLGHFTQQRGAAALVEQAPLEPEQRARVLASLSKLPQSPAQASPRSLDAEEITVGQAPAPVRVVPPKKAQAGSNAADVLRQLNRAKDIRSLDY